MRTDPQTQSPSVAPRLAGPRVVGGPARQFVWRILTLLALALPACGFEGRINVALTEGGQTNALRYTVGPGHLRIEVTDNNWPNPIDIVERQSGALTLVFPHNHSFVRLKPAAETAFAGLPGVPGMSAMPNMPSAPGMPAMPPGGLPPGIGPQSAPMAPQAAPASNVGVAPPVPPPMSAMPNMPALPQGVGPQAGTLAPPAPPPMPAMPGLPPGIGPQPGGAMAGAAAPAAMPRMPMMNQKLELRATGQTTNILGFVCQQYELKQRGETVEFWATDQLLPYQPYLRNQPHRFGPDQFERQWAGLVADRRLFPLIASLRYDSGGERLRFEVTSVSTDKIAEPSEQLFQPPRDYTEIQPLPF